MGTRQMVFFIVLFSFVVVGPASAMAQKSGGSLMVGTPVDVVGLDPHKTSAAATFFVLCNIFERLVEMNESGQPMPGIAKKWSLSNDKLVYTFYLREKIKFHNGRELTAEDVKYSYDRMIDPKTAMPNNAHIKNIQSIKIVDKHTIQFTMKQPTATFLIITAAQQFDAIVPKEEVEKQAGILKRPVGTGPYKFVEYQPDRHVILEKFEGYVQPEVASSGSGGKKPAYAKQIRIASIKDPSVRDMALKTGEIDLSTRLAWEEFDEMKKIPEIAVYEGPGLAAVVLSFGIGAGKNPFVSKAAFRKAVGYCLDLQEIVDGSVFGHSAANPSLMGQALPFYSAIHKKGYGRNLTTAKALLKEAGYSGEPIKLAVCKRYPMAYKAAIVVQQMITQAGINVTLEVKEWAAHLKEWNGGTYEMTSIILSPVVDPAQYMNTLHSQRNHNGYKNIKLDGLAEKAEIIDDFENRKKIYEQIHLLMLEDAPILKLFDHSAGFGARKYVKGIKVWPDTSNFRLWNLWLDK